MNKENIIDYVVQTPHNPNKKVLDDMLETLIEENGSPGECDWNTMKNKPFGEEVVISDTIEWDGTDKDIIVGGMMHYVCGSVPKPSDFIGGTYEMVREGNATVFSIQEDSIQPGGDIYFVSGTIAVIPQENYEVAEIGMTFPKKGIYFLKESATTYVKSVTAPTPIFEVVEVQTLDPKYLPEHLQFGEEMGAIFEETSLIIDENGVNNLDIEIPLVAGEMYRVTWNGEVYNCVAKTVTSDGATIVFIGNPDGSSNEPFSVASYPKELWESTLCKATIMSTTPSITVPICIEGKVIKPLDPKYLPSGVDGGGGTSNFEELENNPFAKVVEDYLLVETKPTFAPLEEMGGIPAFNPYLKGLPIEGKTYTVNWNGTTYECVARYVENPVYSSVMIGDASLVGGDGNGEPFLMTFALSGGVFNTPMCICLAVAEETADTLSIYGEYERKLYSEHLEKYVYRLDNAVPPLEHMSESQEYRIDYATAFEISTLINNGVTPWLALSFVHPVLDKQSALIRPTISCDSVGGSKVRFYFIYNFVCYEMTVDRVDSLGINNDLIPAYGKVTVKSKEL